MTNTETNAMAGHKAALADLQQGRAGYQRNVMNSPAYRDAYRSTIDGARR